MIQPDGYFALKEIGDFYAQGKTAPELRDGLQQAYATIMNKPTATVDLKGFQKPRFIAGGEVGHPGKYGLEEDTTAAAGIAIAGEFTSSSKHSQVLLFRRVSDNTVEVKRLNIMLNTANLQERLTGRPMAMARAMAGS
jgi:protein involved in polysaccharide export with SLBB domain